MFLDKASTNVVTMVA